jgi:D-serine dehydratase
MVDAMKLIRVLVASAALLSATAAFADKAEKAPPRDEVSQADAERFLAFFEKFVSAVVVNKDNCPKMAGAIGEVIDANTDVIKMANDAKAAKKKLPRAIEDKMMARVKDMTPAMQKCGKDEKVKEAVGRLDPKQPKK